MDSKDEKLDAVREIAHIGAGNASKSLSKLTGRTIEVEFPEIEERKIEDVPNLLGDQNRTVTASSVQMYTELDGDENSLGRIALIMDYDGSKRLASLMNNEEDPEEGLTEMDISALKELGNILAGTCLSAVSEVLDFKIYESTPFLHTDMVGAIMEGMVVDMIETHDEILVFKTRFHSEEDVDAYFMFLFTEYGYESILEGIEGGINLEVD